MLKLNRNLEKEPCTDKRSDPITEPIFPIHFTALAELLDRDLASATVVEPEAVAEDSDSHCDSRGSPSYTPPKRPRLMPEPRPSPQHQQHQVHVPVPQRQEPPKSKDAFLGDIHRQNNRANIGCYSPVSYK